MQQHLVVPHQRCRLSDGIVLALREDFQVMRGAGKEASLWK
jgi:hypothetical protein